MTKTHIAIDPYAAGHVPGANYVLLLSRIVPRPMAFLSTRSAAGGSAGDTENLAPFSYFQMASHDPPLFVVGFSPPPAGQGRLSKDTLRNLVETGECVINVISEGFAEAANATSVGMPYGVSEWEASGLTRVYDCRDVRCARVKEAVFSVEARLESVREFKSKVDPGTTSLSMVVLEGTHFWLREDVLNEERTEIDQR